MYRKVFEIDRSNPKKTAIDPESFRLVRDFSGFSMQRFINSKVLRKGMEIVRKTMEKTFDLLNHRYILYSIMVLMVMMTLLATIFFLKGWIL